MLEGLKGTFEVAQEPFFSRDGGNLVQQDGQALQRIWQQHHTLDTDAEELNGPLQATTKQKEFRIKN